MRIRILLYATVRLKQKIIKQIVVSNFLCQNNLVTLFDVKTNEKKRRGLIDDDVNNFFFLVLIFKVSYQELNCVCVAKDDRRRKSFSN